MGNYSPTKWVWSGEQLGEWNDCFGRDFDLMSSFLCFSILCQTVKMTVEVHMNKEN